MGLDMYLWKCKLNEVGIEDAYEKVAYWRKHYALQDYVDENIKHVENCVDIKLSKNDLEDMLKFALMELEMEETEYSYQSLINGVEKAITDEHLDWDVYQNLRTVEQISKILLDTDFEKEVILYWAWW